VSAAVCHVSSFLPSSYSSIQSGFMFAEFFFDKFLFQFTEWVFVCRAFYVALLSNVCPVYAGRSALFWHMSSLELFF
jgi:hypothetical protein